MLRYRVVFMRQKSVIKHFDHLCNTRDGNFRAFWWSLRPLVQTKKRAQNDLTIFKENSRIINEQTQVAEIFNDYFTNITDRLTLRSNISHMPLAYQRRVQPVRGLLVVLQTTTK